MQLPRTVWLIIGPFEHETEETDIWEVLGSHRRLRSICRLDDLHDSRSTPYWAVSFANILPIEEYGLKRAIHRELRKIRRFNRYYTLPILLKGHDRLIGVFRRTDGQYCGCKCFAARTFEPWLLTNDALVLQVARYEDELAHAGGREIASFPNCARDDTSTDRRSAGNGAQETAHDANASSLIVEMFDEARSWTGFLAVSQTDHVLKQWRHSSRSIHHIDYFGDDVLSGVRPS
ncbi:MAG: hypothetical protein ALECFALPRED_001480 [Alectoria fallacina]|uniref:Uncharacterized protein n=1 Tax=Alectoria fallacina TaxID=1903189 RepID=A0A8H3I9V8_9LECA|nr:MAG: hypothetical protein ALECFALPRED_001480 [Alectoria fallacina]